MSRPSLYSRPRQRGYTLVELAVSLTIIAMLISGGMAMFTARNSVDMANETADRLKVIQEALRVYAKEHGHLPCPAATAGIASTDATYGQASLYNSTGTLTSAQQCGVIEGMLPIRVRDAGLSTEIPALKISEEYAYDAWGRRFTYRIAMGLGSAQDFANPAYKGDLRIEDVRGNERTEINRPAPDNFGAAYVVISHGSNGAGAYTKDGTRLSTALAVGREAENGDDAANVIYVQNDRTASFDDVVAFQTKSQLAHIVRLSAPLAPASATCAAAAKILGEGAPQSGRNTQLDQLVTAGYSDTQAQAIYASAASLQRVCDNPPVNACAATPDLLPSAPYLRAWYDADDIATVSYDVSSKLVTEWRDKIQGLDMISPGGAARPFLLLGTDEGAWNGRNLLLFNGNMTLRRESVEARAFVGMNGSPAVGDTITIFVAQRYSSNGGGNTNVPFAWDFGGANVMSLSLPAGSGNLDWSFGSTALGTGRITTPPPADFNDEWHVLTAVHDGSGNSSQLYVDSDPAPIANSAASATLPINNLRELSISPAGGRFTGNIGEILVYRRALTAMERRDVEDYLRQKWIQPGFGYCFKKNNAASRNSCMTGMKKGADSQNIGVGCVCMAHQVQMEDVKNNSRYFAPCMTPKFVTGGSDGRGAFSPEGTGWYPAGGAGGRILAAGDQVNAIKFSATRKVWVAVGNNEQIARSLNGRDWTVRNNVSGGVMLRAADYDPVNGRWLAVGDGGKIYASTDNGETWAAMTQLWDGSIDAFGIAHAPEKATWVVVGSGGRILYSSDNAATWSEAAGSELTLPVSAIANGNTLRAVIYRTHAEASNRYWIAVGDAGAVAYSTDGENWFNANALGGRNITTVDSDPVTKNIVIAGADGYSSYSSSPASWIAPTAAIFGGGDDILGVVYDPGYNRWVAVGEGGRVAYSSAGSFAYQANGALAWTELPSVLGGGNSLRALWALK